MNYGFGGVFYLFVFYRYYNLILYIEEMAYLFLYILLIMLFQKPLLYKIILSF